jgi:hypothetical protein
MFIKLIYFILLFLFLPFLNESTLTKSCSGHDGCKGDEWIGSYHVTCNGGERICHNTILKCGRENCKITDTTKCIQIYTSSKIKNIHINTNI